MPVCTDPVEPDCEKITCENGTCKSAYEPDGTKLSDAKQTLGNCKAKTCDGVGKVVNVNDDLDLPDDTNDCTTDTCAGGVAKNDPVAVGTACSNATQVCDATGTCVACNVDADCKNGAAPSCDKNKCVPATCLDGKKNGDETDVDCGGSCNSCGTDKTCLKDADCLNLICTSLKCAAAACDDGIKNGSESDLDCGGSCLGCGPSLKCSLDADCAGKQCDAGPHTCTPNCGDGVPNNNETDVDCGGDICDKCADGSGCKAAADCSTGGCCNAPAGTCSTCCDGVKDGTESDLDCGGSCALTCADNATCTGGGDCLSALCQNFTCKPSTCSNGTLDVGEADADCGGPCQPCTQGKLCLAKADCASGFCTDGVCCNVACGGLCEACVKAKTGLADGGCQPVTTNTDPDAECAPAAVPTCGQNGMCDGNRACAKYDANTECVSASCANGTQTNPSKCDGKGVCPAPTMKPCAPYVCGANACKASCASDGDCIAADYCDTPGAGGVCKPKLAQGGACAGNNQCISGNCSGNKCIQPSCAGGLTCGGISCCDAPVVPGGTFKMGRSVVNGDPDYYPSGGGGETPAHDATVADFRLDTFEVTVGRFRKFIAQFDGTPPAVNAGAHPLIANSGWQQGWNGSLALTKAALITNLKCDATFKTWTDTDAEGHESYPVNCVSWFEAFAFCAWDEGRMPTEAEWEYAAAGGSDDRLYPWGSTDPEVTKTLANDRFSDDSPFIVVGSHPSGNGKWLHRDLAGGMDEWNLDWNDVDWYSAGGKQCSNCANLGPGSIRVIRGGYWDAADNLMRAAGRNGYTPTTHHYGIGFRCARSAP